MRKDDLHVRELRTFCPDHARAVTCTVVDDGVTCFEVLRCSRFEEGEPRCAKRCVELMNAGFDLESDGDG
jgi:hypothetical protein